MKIIKITYYKQLLRVVPYRIGVPLGEEILWDFESDLIYPRPTIRGSRFGGQLHVNSLRLIIYFEDSTPFKKSSLTFVSQSSTGSHSMEIKAGPTAKRGDYKYGVRLIDVITDTELEDEDPYLIVD